MLATRSQPATTAVTLPAAMSAAAMLSAMRVQGRPSWGRARSWRLEAGGWTHTCTHSQVVSLAPWLYGRVSHAYTCRSAPRARPLRTLHTDSTS